MLNNSTSFFQHAQEFFGVVLKKGFTPVGEKK